MLIVFEPSRGSLIDQIRSTGEAMKMAIQSDDRLDGAQLSNKKQRAVFGI